MESGNDYVLQVKGNQPKLLKAIKGTIRNSKAVDIDYSLEKNRGRREEREVHVFAVEDNEVYNQWLMVSYIIHVAAKGKRNGHEYKEDRYYLTNKKMINANQYNSGIRNHWGIENLLHWVKDVIMKEDGGLVKDMKRCRALSVMRNIVMNIFRVTGHRSIKYAIEKFTNRIDECLKLIHGNNYILNI